MREKKVPEKISADRIVLFLTKEAYKAAEEAEEMKNPAKNGGLDFLAKLDTVNYYFAAALAIAKKFSIGKSTASFLVVDYTSKFAKADFFVGSHLPPPKAILEFAKLGAPNSVTELLLKELVKKGQLRDSLDAARLLGRDLREDEVLSLVKNYADGAVDANETEERLMELAKKCLSADGFKKAEKMIRDHKHRSDCDLY